MRRASILLLLGAGLVLHDVAQALEDGRRGRRAEPPALGVREPPRRSATVPIDRVIEQIERRYRARVVRADQAEMNGRVVYVLRLLSDDGVVKTVRVDADTGTVM